jgi:hypothetical protein
MNNEFSTASKNTYESTQQRNINPATGPRTGIYPNPRETSRDDSAITNRYAEVAIAVKMPV